jgi:hypothetical protein
VGAPDRVGAHLGEADVAHVALPHELGDRSHGLLYGNVRIEPRGLVEVDVVGA